DAQPPSQFTPDAAVLSQRMFYNGRIFHGTLGLYERTEEVLVIADYPRPDATRKPDRVDPRLCCGAIHLHVVLISYPLSERLKPQRPFSPSRTLKEELLGLHLTLGHRTPNQVEGEYLPTTALSSTPLDKRGAI